MELLLMIIAPRGHTRKCDLFGLGSILGGVVGAISANQVADKQAAMQKETNENNYKMHQENIQLQKWQQQEQMKYDSAEEQMKRWRAAGLNPNMMMDGATAGSMSTFVPDSSGAAQTADITGIGSAGIGAMSQGIGQFVDSMLTSKIREGQANVLQSQNQGLELDNSLKAQTMIDNVRALHYDTDTKEILLQTARDTMQANITTANERARQEQWNTRILSLSHQNATFQAATARYQFYNFLPVQLQAMNQGIAESSARTFQAITSGKLNLRQIEHLMVEEAQNWQRIQIGWMDAGTNRMNAHTNKEVAGANIAYTEEQTKGAKQNREQASKLFKLNYDNISLGVELLRKQVGSFNTDKIFNRIESASRSFSNIVGSIKGFGNMPTPAQNTQQSFNLYGAPSTTW